MPSVDCDCDSGCESRLCDEASERPGLTERKRAAAGDPAEGARNARAGSVAASSRAGTAWQAACPAGGYGMMLGEGVRWMQMKSNRIPTGVCRTAQTVEAATSARLGANLPGVMPGGFRQ